MWIILGVMVVVLIAVGAFVDLDTGSTSYSATSEDWFLSPGGRRVVAISVFSTGDQTGGPYV